MSKTCDRIIIEECTINIAFHLGWYWNDGV